MAKESKPVDCNIQRQLAAQVASHQYGDLNPMEKSEFGKKVNELSTVMTALKNLQKAPPPSTAPGQGSMKAVVLYAWKEELHGGSVPRQIVCVKAIIVEQNDLAYPAALPLDNNPKDPCADWGSINLHTTFFGVKPGLPLPKPTDIIKVDFGNRGQRREPHYIELVSSSLLKCQADLKKSPGNCQEALKRNMEKVSERKTPKDGVPASRLGFSPEPKAAPPLDPNKAPAIGVYLPPFLHKYKKDRNPKKIGYWTADWVERVANAGINYVCFKLHGARAAKDGTMYDNDYTKKVTGRTVKEQVSHILKVARTINPEFEVHAWGFSGVQRWGTGEKKTTGTGAIIARPRNEQEAQQMAIREAQAVGKKMNFLGLKDYHWNAEHSALQGYPGHSGFSGNPLPGKRTGSSFMLMNDLVAATFANELRKQVPGARIWFNGFIECISQRVLMEYFDVVEPQSWPVGVDSFRKKFDGKHLGAPDGRQLLPAQMQVSWTIPDGGYGGTYDNVNRAEAWTALKDKIIEYKTRIYGVNIFAMSSLLHQGYDGWPSIPEQVQQLKEGFNRT